MLLHIGIFLMGFGLGMMATATFLKLYLAN